MITSFRVPLYGALVYVSLSDSPATARAEMENVFGPTECSPEQTAALCAYTATGIYGVFLNPADLAPGVIAHELFHLSVHIADWAGIPVMADNHEAVAYLHGWVNCHGAKDPVASVSTGLNVPPPGRVPAAEVEQNEVRGLVLAASPDNLRNRAEVVKPLISTGGASARPWASRLSRSNARKRRCLQQRRGIAQPQTP